MKREFENLCSALELEIDIIDFAHVTSFFLSNNNNSLKSLNITQKKRFDKLCTEQHPKPTLQTKNSPAKKLNYADYLAQF